MKNFHSSVEVPRNLRGYTCWLQVRYGGDWQTVCNLRPADLRQVCRWLDHHPFCATVRVMVESTG